MMDPDALSLRLSRALHPLAMAPGAAPWNLAELDGLPLAYPPQPAAVLVGIRPAPSGASVLLTRRTEQLREHAGQVSFPGGRIDALDADPVAAALREASEEIGLERGQARPLGYIDPYLTITGYRVLPVVAVIDPGFQPRANPAEVAEVFEVPLALLLDPARLEQVDIPFAGRIRHVLQYRYRPHRIWGATASILYNLRERLAGAGEGAM